MDQQLRIYRFDDVSLEYATFVFITLAPNVERAWQILAANTSSEISMEELRLIHEVREIEAVEGVAISVSHF